MRILIFGGTGIIGSELSSRLSLNNTVFVSSRKHRDDKNNIHFIKGNAQDISFIKTLADDWDVIIDLMNYPSSVFSSNHDVLFNKTKHYVFVSSSRVYSDSGISPITEKSPVHLHISDDKFFLSSNEYVSPALAV